MRPKNQRKTNKVCGSERDWPNAARERLLRFGTLNWRGNWAGCVVGRTCASVYFSIGNICGSHDSRLQSAAFCDTPANPRGEKGQSIDLNSLVGAKTLPVRISLRASCGSSWRIPGTGATRGRAGRELQPAAERLQVRGNRRRTWLDLAPIPICQRSNLKSSIRSHKFRGKCIHSSATT